MKAASNRDRRGVDVTTHLQSMPPDDALPIDECGRTLHIEERTIKKAIVAGRIRAAWGHNPRLQGVARKALLVSKSDCVAEKRRVDEGHGPHFIDIAPGTKFGDYKVDSFSHANGRAYYNVTCMLCGRRRVVASGDLRSKKATRCTGCYYASKEPNRSGKSIGNWKIIEPARIGRNRYWCECKSCGQKKVLAITQLKSKVKCRQCWQYPIRMDLSGQRFGPISVPNEAEVAKGTDGVSRWPCKCDCGRTLSLPTERLTQIKRRGQKTCGFGCTLPSDQVETIKKSTTAVASPPAAVQETSAMPIGTKIENYVTASRASRITAMTLRALNHLCRPDGPVRSYRPNPRRLMVHLHDLEKYISERDA